MTKYLACTVAYNIILVMFLRDKIHMRLNKTTKGLLHLQHLLFLPR